MEITERQKEMLGELINEYIRSGFPVSSQTPTLRKKFGISSATIRNEMHELLKQDYIYQPHISAGRIPTDKGYRFFVNSILEEFNFGQDEREGVFVRYFQEDFPESDIIRLSQRVAQQMAKLSSSLTIIYLKDQGVVLKEGWGGLLKEPEFQERETLANFIELVDTFEEDIEHFFLTPLKRGKDILVQPMVYIGKENPLAVASDFSMLFSMCCLPGSEEGGIVFLLGPKRMPYKKNISLLKFVARYFEKEEDE